MVYSVTKYGAVGDGATNDAAAIQSAIDACNAAGGGRVVLEGGHTYYSSSIELKSNVELHLEQGALLKAHSDISTYFNPNGDDASVAAVSGAKAVDRPVAKPAYTFIHAKDADNFSITGQGAVDGNVYAFMKRASRYYFNGDFYPRPTMVYVEHCNHISFHDVTLQNSPFWTLHPAGCNDVLISNIRVLNPLDCTNSDGIDPDHSTNVRIIGCHVQCADDCICLKTTAGNNEYGPTKNVIISNTGYTGAGGFELYFYPDDAMTIWNAIFEAGKPEGIKPIGLGARDTLRLEMGFCLYGNDLDDTTSPIEAGLGWITKFAEGKNFTNRAELERQKKEGVSRKLCAFELVDKGIPRHGYEIADAEGNIIGVVTSGTMSPVLKKGIGMGYVKPEFAKAGTEICIKVRGRNLKAQVVKAPFRK